MKSNMIKYIFAIIIIGLMIYACYLIYGKQEEVNNEAVEVGKIQEVEKITNIRIPIVNFDTINPILSGNQNIQDLARLVYEPLLNIDEKNRIELCLAKEWTKQSDTSYVVKLKENIKWSNGKKLTAKDVQYTIDRLKDPNVISIYSYNVQDVIGIEVIDEYTIKINLEKEVPFFEYNLIFPIMSYEYFLEEDFVTTAKNINPVGTGRFKVTTKNGTIFLEQNENWWNIEEDPTYLTQIELVKYQNMGEVYNAFKIGNIDLFTTNTMTLEDYIGTIGYNKKEFHGRKLDYIAFNCESSVLSTPEVRKAISYVISKENIISSIYQGKYYSSNFPLDYGSYLYENRQISYEYNVEKAEQILQQSGWNHNRKTWQKTVNYRTQRLSLNFVVNSSNEQRVAVAENIKQALEDFGIGVTLRKVSDIEYQNRLNNKNYDMILTGVSIGYSPDVSNYFGENNIANYKNDEVLQLIQEAKEIKEEKMQKEKYARIIQIYEEEMPYVFLYFNKSMLIYSSKLVGQMDPNSYNIYEGIGSWYRQ